MKAKIPWIVAGLFVLWALAGLRAPKENSEFHLHQFGQIPVLLNGRIQPIDSVARNALLTIRGAQSVSYKLQEVADPGDIQPVPGSSKHGRLTPIEWLTEVAFAPEVANRRYLFRVHHPEVISNLGLEDKGIHKSGLYWYTFQELEETPGLLARVESEYKRVQSVDAKLRNPREQQIMRLQHSLILYHRLRNTFRSENSDDFAAELDRFVQSIPAGVQAVQARESGQEFDQEVLSGFLKFVRQAEQINYMAYPLIIPPADPTKDRDAWTNIGTNLLAAVRTQSIPTPVRDYARMASAFRANQPEEFNAALDELQTELSEPYAPEFRKGALEFLFNHYAPFDKAQVMYVLAVLLAAVYWLKRHRFIQQTGFYVMIVAFLVQSSGVIFRMVLEGRPPVTNLYSSAVFVGWGAVLLGIIMEKIYRDGIGTLVGSIIGFITLMVAYALSLDGDTMEMLQAVLDTNAWLATHVVTIAIGYSATFVAGFLALVYILRGMLTRSLDKETARSLNRMVYGVICFGLFFSFIGTILGGIWADQSWGRFWGWDPKENGALLIVLWNAAILHARWGGIIRERGLMVMAVFGNVVTGFSWFGVNLLGVGLHAYGFMEGSFKWLTLFSVSQLVILGLAWAIPQRYWMSFRKTA